jgi:LemA protein
MPFAAAAWFAVLLLVVVVGFVVLATYNDVVALGQRIDKAWANVDVALKQRHDELPNLVAAVRDVMGFEQAVLEEVSRLRNAYDPARPVPEQGALSTETSRAVRSLLAVVENYPALKSHDNVMALQAEIERLESTIADRRELYNDQVYRYNTRIRQVPAVILAGPFDWRPRDFFAAGDADRVRPDVSLHPASQAATGARSRRAPVGRIR